MYCCLEIIGIMKIVNRIISKWKCCRSAMFLDYAKGCFIGKKSDDRVFFPDCFIKTNSDLSHLYYSKYPVIKKIVPLIYNAMTTDD